MNDKFDVLAKGLAQSVTRRGALKKFGLGLAGVVLASLGLAPRSHAGRFGCNCKNVFTYGCDRSFPVGSQAYYNCVFGCAGLCADKHSHCC